MKLKQKEKILEIELKAWNRMGGYVDDDNSVKLTPRYKIDSGRIMTLVNRIAHGEVKLKIDKRRFF